MGSHDEVDMNRTRRLAIAAATLGFMCGAIFGAVGLILAAPITSAITRISADLARARAKEAERAPPPAEAAPAEGAAPA